MSGADLHDLLAAIQALRDMTIGEVRARYVQVMEKPTRSFNGPALRHTIARRLAERALAMDPSPTDRRRIRRAIDEAKAPRPKPEPIRHDPRIPPVGTVLKKRHGEEVIEVKVTRTGFTYRGRAYRSLSAIAREVTGARWNGLLFFGLTARRRTPRPGRSAS